MTTDARLVAYLPNGASQGPLPTPTSWEASSVLNDVGALTMEYGAYAPRAALLGQPLEIAVETSTDGGVTYAERRNSRFLYLRDGRDPVQDTSWSASCVSYVKRLEKALVPFTGLNSNGQRVFATKTVGDILNTLFTEAQARGAMTGMAWDFTATLDSSGTAWGGTQSIAFDAGKDFLGILQDWADLGVLDYSTQGRTIQVWRPATLGGDKTTTANPVSLRRGRDYLDGPFARTWENLADTALVQGDGAAVVTRTNGAAVRPWGTQETLVSAAGVTDTGTLQTIGDLALAQTGDQRTSFTNGLALAQSVYNPLVDYEPGSYVYSDNAGGSDVAGAAVTRVRVRQITLTWTGEALTGNVVLNDRFTEADVLTRDLVTRLLNGGTPAIGGSTTPYGNDILPPAQVTGASASSISYLGMNGTRYGQITVSWTNVTTNNDGTTAGDIDHYEVWRRPAGGQFALMENTPSTPSTSSLYVPGTTWEFQVRAVDAVGNRGAFSSIVSVVASGDATAPNPPSTPTVVSVKLGAVNLSWDGKDNAAAAMPADFWYAEAHVSTTSGFTPVKGDPTTLVATLLKGSQFMVTGKAPGVYYVKLLAIDTSGNASAASAQATYTIVTVQNTELSATAIDGMTITGAIIRTATSGARLQIENDAAGGVLKFYSSVSGGNPGFINPGASNIVIQSPTDLSLINPATLTLSSGPGGTLGSTINLAAKKVTADGTVGGAYSAAAGARVVLKGGILLGANATPYFECQTMGAFAGTTSDVNGTCTVTHNLLDSLGVAIAPQIVMITPRGLDQIFQVFSVSTTTFVARCRTNAGAFPATGTSAPFFWMALG